VNAAVHVRVVVRQRELRRPAAAAPAMDAVVVVAAAAVVPSADPGEGRGMNEERRTKNHGTRNDGTETAVHRSHSGARSAF
jgi:hypothetical protein